MRLPRDGQLEPSEVGTEGSEASPTAEAEATPRRGARRPSRPVSEQRAEETTSESQQAAAGEAATSAERAASEAETPPPPATLLRAEQLLDEALVWGAAFGTVLAQRAQKLIARAREELEDLVAEADAIRSQWRAEFRRRTGSHR